MGYLDELNRYRNELNSCIDNNDALGVKINAIGCMKLLNLMAEEITSFKDRAVVTCEANRYRDIAVAVKLEGLSDRVIRAVKYKELISFEKANVTTVSQDEKPKEEPLEIPCGVGLDDIGSMLSAASDTVDATPTEDKTQKATIPKEPAQGTDIITLGEEWSADIFEKYAPATLEVHVQYGNGYVGSGTGFIIWENGYFITNHHVVYEGTKLCKQINVVSGDEQIYDKAKVIAADKDADVALLKLQNPPSKAPIIPLIENYAEVRAGADIMLIGNGLSFGLAPLTGTVKFPHRKCGDELVYTAQTNSGDSGSPVINRHGYCIGIHKAREDESGRRDARGIAYATPADEITKLLEKWKKEFNL